LLEGKQEERGKEEAVHLKTPSNTEEKGEGRYKEGSLVQKEKEESLRFPFHLHSRKREKKERHRRGQSRARGREMFIYLFFLTATEGGGEEGREHTRGEISVREEGRGGHFFSHPPISRKEKEGERGFADSPRRKEDQFSPSSLSGDDEDEEEGGA